MNPMIANLRPSHAFQELAGIWKEMQFLPPFKVKYPWSETLAKNDLLLTGGGVMAEYF